MPKRKSTRNNKNTLKKKVNKFKFGFKQIIIEVLTGLLTTFVLAWLTNQGYLPDTVTRVINIILIIMNILLIKSMLSWGVFYTIGWLIGSVIFFEIGLLGTWDIILYIVLPVAVLIVRLFIAVKRSVAA